MARLHLTVEGELGNIALDLLALMLERSHSILRRLDCAVSGEQTGTMQWVVAGIKEGDSRTIELRNRVMRGEEDYGVQVGELYVEGIRCIETQGATPPCYDLDALQDLQAMTRAFGRNGVDALSVSMPDHNREATLSRKSNATLQSLTGVHHKTIGSVEGRVEMVSLHEGSRRFNVYHAVTNRAITCALPPELEERVIEDLKHRRRVRVSGEISYTARGEALSVDVDRYRTLPDEAELPPLEATLGIAPDFTGGRSTEGYIRSLRDG